MNFEHVAQFTLPLADPSLMITSTVTFSDANLSIIIFPDKVLSFSAIKYCVWLIDTLATTDQHYKLTLNYPYFTYQHYLL